MPVRCTPHNPNVNQVNCLNQISDFVNRHLTLWWSPTLYGGFPSHGGASKSSKSHDFVFFNLWWRLGIPRWNPRISHIWCFHLPSYIQLLYPLPWAAAIETAPAPAEDSRPSAARFSPTIRKDMLRKRIDMGTWGDQQVIHGTWGYISWEYSTACNIIRNTCMIHMYNMSIIYIHVNIWHVSKTNIWMCQKRMRSPKTHQPMGNMNEWINMMIVEYCEIGL